MLRSENRGEPPTFRGSAKIGGFLAANFSPTFLEKLKKWGTTIYWLYKAFFAFERLKRDTDRLVPFNMQNAQFLMDLLSLFGTTYWVLGRHNKYQKWFYRKCYNVIWFFIRWSRAIKYNLPMVFNTSCSKTPIFTLPMIDFCWLSTYISYTEYRCHLWRPLKIENSLWLYLIINIVYLINK